MNSVSGSGPVDYRRTGEIPLPWDLSIPYMPQYISDKLVERLVLIHLLPIEHGECGILTVMTNDRSWIIYRSILLMVISESFPSCKKSTKSTGKSLLYHVHSVMLQLPQVYHNFFMYKETMWTLELRSLRPACVIQWYLFLICFFLKNK